MFEVSKVNVHRGIFEWELEGSMPKLVAWVGRLGPVKVRILSLSLILSSLFFTFNNTFANWLFHGIGMTSYSAIAIQTYLKWALAGFGMLVWLGAFLFRKPYALLVMDRPQGIVNLLEQSFWSVSPRTERVYRFEDVDNIEVFSKDRQPQTPQGFVRMRFKSKGSGQDPHELSFRFLTAEQFQFFPTNLYKIIGKEPKGDWSEELSPEGLSEKT